MASSAIGSGPDVSMGQSALGTLRDGRAFVVAAQGQARRHLLVLRFAILNAGLLACVSAAALQGWLDQMIASDVFHIMKLIAVVFLIGLYQCAVRLFQLTAELNALDGSGTGHGTRGAAYLQAAQAKGEGSRSLLASSLKLKLGTRLGHIRFIANVLVMLGLIGTVVGFIVALGGVDPSAVSEATAVGPMVSTLLLGMGMAMYKTLAGIVLNIWLMLNYRLVEHGTVHFYTQLIERGEAR